MIMDKGSGVGVALSDVTGEFSRVGQPYDPAACILEALKSMTDEEYRALLGANDVEIALSGHSLPRRCFSSSLRSLPSSSL